MRLIRLVVVSLAPAFVGPIPALWVLLGFCLMWLLGRGGREGLWLGMVWTLQLARLVSDQQSLWPVALSGAERGMMVQLERISESRGQGFGPARVVNFDGAESIGQRVWLSWNSRYWHPAVGERWSVRVKLKPLLYSPSLRGDPLANALGKGFFARARITKSKPVLVERSPLSALVRGRLSQRLDGAAPMAAVLGRAVAFGERPQLDHSVQSALEQSGLAHLFSPSGLHVGICVGLLSLVWPSLGRFRGGPVRPGWSVPLGAALVWWLLPTRLPISRAALACGVWAVGQRMPVALSPGRIYWCVLLLCTWVWPWLARMSGAQMSFVAVGWILLATQCPVPKWRRGLAMVVGLSASTAWAGLPLGLASVISNLLWVPLLSFVGMPSLLVGWFTDQWWLWDQFASGLFRYLEWVPNYSLSLRQSAGLSVVAVSLLLPLAIVVLALVPWFGAERPRALLTIYSVGAGQAATLVTTHHAVALDLGNAQPGTQGRIARELQPDLIRHGIRDLDLVLLSHGDADHSAGLDGFAARFGIDQLVSGEPDRVSGAGGCYRGQRWQFDGVALRVLWGGPPGTKNSASCALELSGDFGRVWILGDLPARDQWALARYEGTPALTGLVAAHHGAADGFSIGLAQRQRPDWVVFSQARLGRWAHPAPEVEAAWRAVGAQTYRTGSRGSLRIPLEAGSAVETPARESPWALGYWTSG